MQRQESKYYRFAASDERHLVNWISSLITAAKALASWSGEGEEQDAVANDKFETVSRFDNLFCRSLPKNCTEKAMCVVGVNKTVDFSNHHNYVSTVDNALVGGRTPK